MAIAFNGDMCYLFCNMIKNQQLLHAKAALEYGSFKKAAHAHNISEPAFSRSIAKLEQSLGVKLFSRSQTGVTATVYGRVLEKYGEIVINAISELEREVSLIKGLGIGELSVALGPYPAEISCHTALANLISEHPDLKCRIMVADWREVEALVSTYKADLGIAELSIAKENKQLHVEPFGKHRFVFYCRSGHPILKKKTITKDDFMDYPSVLLRLPARMSKVFPGRLFPVEDSDHVIPSIEFQDIVLSRELVLKSDALGAGTPLQAQKELAEGSLSVIPIFEPWMTLNYGFMYLKERVLSPAAERYMTMVLEVEKDVVLRNEKLMKRYLPASFI